VAIFQTYFFLFIAMATIYTLPVLMHENKGLLYSMNVSIKLFLANGLYTLGTMVQIAAVSLLLAIPVISVPLLFSGMVSIILLNIYQNLVNTAEQMEARE
jgi:uncharacterized membrane protein YesL